jgi:hypothetical protein
MSGGCSRWPIVGLLLAALVIVSANERWLLALLIVGLVAALVIVVLMGWL